MIVSVGGLRVSIRDPGKEGFLGDRAAFAQVFFAGEYDFLLARMSPGDIVLDAGANIGCFTLRASRRVGPRGVVIAVEPEPSNVACLTANIRLNRITNVIVVGKALDAVPDRAVNLVGTGTTAHVDEIGITSHVSDPTAGTARTVVRTMTLDDVLVELVLDRLDVIKMDIEGSENSIFATASTSSVLAAAKAVAVEVHDREGSRLVQNRLRADGYSYVSQPKSESAFLLSSIRRAAGRPDLVLKLYGIEAASVVTRMVLRVVRKQPEKVAHLLAMVYASR
ncbi:MAG TPA: FkbM family methyltransferase [Blastocatellia bacterium]|nr:FkbM family methyltransferase [Blastocatellia bacterium]